MVISLTKLSDKQWSRVGKVVMWSAISAALAIATAYVANNPAWLVTYPGWNIAGVLLQQILTEGEDKALSELPPVLEEEVKTEADKLAAEVVTPTASKVAEPVPAPMNEVPVVPVVDPPTAAPTVPAS